MINQYPNPGGFAKNPPYENPPKLKIRGVLLFFAFENPPKNTRGPRKKSYLGPPGPPYGGHCSKCSP